MGGASPGWAGPCRELMGEWAGRAGSGRGEARPGAEARRGGSHVARAHMTGGAMDPLPAAAVTAAAEVEADEEADLPAAGKTVGRAGGAPGPATPGTPRPSAPFPPGRPAGSVRPLPGARVAPGARSAAAGPGTRAPVRVGTSPRTPARVFPGLSDPGAAVCPPHASPVPPIPRRGHRAWTGGARPVPRSLGTWPLSSVNRPIARKCASERMGVDPRSVRAGGSPRLPCLMPPPALTGGPCRWVSV